MNLEFVPFPTSGESPTDLLPGPPPPEFESIDDFVDTAAAAPPPLAAAPPPSAAAAPTAVVDLEHQLFPDLPPLDLSAPAPVDAAPIFGGRAVISGLALAAVLGSGIGFITMRATAPSDSQVRLIADGDNGVSLGSGGTDPVTGAPLPAGGDPAGATTGGDPASSSGDPASGEDGEISTTPPDGAFDGFSATEDSMGRRVTSTGITPIVGRTPSYDPSVPGWVPSTGAGGAAVAPPETSPGGTSPPATSPPPPPPTTDPPPPTTDPPPPPPTTDPPTTDPPTTDPPTTDPP